MTTTDAISEARAQLEKTAGELAEKVISTPSSKIKWGCWCPSCGYGGGTHYAGCWWLTIEDLALRYRTGKQLLDSLEREAAHGA